MELDELKKTWAALDNRLKENNLLKETIIREIIQGKAGKSLKRLLAWEILNTSACFVVIPFLWHFLSHFKSRIIFFLLIYTIALLFLSIIWYSYKVYGLMKFDLAKSVSNNIYYIGRYNLQIKWEKLIGIPATSVIVILLVLVYAEVNASIFAWIPMSFGVIFSGLFTYWYYKRVCGKNIGSILKSLDELKSLKEKEE
ncbi:MAG: hypothetical protein LBK65_07020 [Tannerellaceae bacterium]|jgi:hypothetical protein|nr:hypothetical protein [Tannerellaceae bacterium]